MKLRSLTNNPKIAKANTAKKTTKKKKKKLPKVTYVDNQLLPLSLALEISKNYKGISDSIGGVLHSLPKELKSLFSNSEIKTLVVRQGYAMFVLDNSFTFFIKDKIIRNTTYQDIRIKHRKAQVFSSIV